MVNSKQFYKEPYLSLQGVWSLNIMHSLLKLQVFVAGDGLVYTLELTQEKTMSSLENTIETLAMSTGKQWSAKH